MAIDALLVTLFSVLADISMSEALTPPLFDSSILLLVVFLAVNSFEEQHPTGWPLMQITS
jgi:hypothetical protein